jgi:hypothetical protein
MSGAHIAWGLRSMAFVVVSIIYAGTVLLYVGTAAWIVRAWTRRRYWHKSPSDLHYIAVGIILLVSAGIESWSLRESLWRLAMQGRTRMRQNGSI